MSQFEKTLLIDEAYKSYLFVPTDDGLGVVIMERTTLKVAEHLAFSQQCIHPYFVNLLVAAPLLYQELSRQTMALENLIGVLEARGFAKPELVEAMERGATSAQLTLMLARDGAAKYADAISRDKCHNVKPS